MIEPGTKAAESARIDSVERILSMTREEVDDLPYGFIVLDGEGTILLYNRYEARMARLSPERVVGRNFFRDIAPCARVEAFHGRFRALVEDPAILDLCFAFRFHFLHGAQDVMVSLSRVPEGDAAGSALAGARVFMVVERRLLAHPEGSEVEALRLDLDRGRAVGPQGPVFPLSAEVLASMLVQLGLDGAREIGRGLGSAAAATAQRHAAHTGEDDLARAPAQLAAGALDDAMARSGLGRLALDQTARAQEGVIGCLVRPAIELPARSIVSLYEGLLESALGAVLGAQLVARCLDDRDMLAFPWRFAVVPEAGALELWPRPGERADDVARRLGLLVDADDAV